MKSLVIYERISDYQISIIYDKTNLEVYGLWSVCMDYVTATVIQYFTNTVLHKIFEEGRGEGMGREGI
jgi:hypothetical protein